MSAEIRDDGKDYWTLLSRYNRNRGSLMQRIVVKEMIALLQRNNLSDAVRLKARAWVARNQKSSPNNDGGSSGPRYA